VQHRAAIVEHRRRNEARAIVRKIVRRDDASPGGKIGDDRLRDLAFVEVARTRVREAFQSARQSRVAQPLLRLPFARHRRAPVGEEDRAACRECIEPGRVDCD